MSLAAVELSVHVGRRNGVCNAFIILLVISFVKQNLKHNYLNYMFITFNDFGPSGVRALPLAAGIFLVIIPLFLGPLLL
jgi:hypothetical protein